MGLQDDVEELAQANLYRRMCQVFEQNDRGPIMGRDGKEVETVRLRLLLGLGVAMLLFLYGITSGEPFIMGMGFLPLVVFGAWLLVRWKTASDARAKQLEILAWFKARKKPFPYHSAAEVIDPLERIDWEDAHKHDALKSELTELAERNWDDAVIIARRTAALPLFGRMMIEKARREKELPRKQGILTRLLQDPDSFGLGREELLARSHSCFGIGKEGRSLRRATIAPGRCLAVGKIGRRSQWPKSSTPAARSALQRLGRPLDTCQTCRTAFSGRSRFCPLRAPLRPRSRHYGTTGRERPGWLRRTW